jgi:RNA polymerase sigma factor (sigma-70 family)
LLAQYVNAGSEDAFRELVARYVDLVYSAAVRLVNNDIHLAEDVTQTVFADLARKAPSLSPKVMLGGWLHRHTCFVASNLLRGERRRQLREQQAAQMSSTPDHSADDLAAVAPILDDAINQLGADDRAAILLRFFEQRDFRSVGEALGSNEEAARKRVNRALDKLQLLLRRRGVACSVTALGAVLAAQAVAAAPAGFAAGVATSALAGVTVSHGATLTIVKIMSMTKLKIGIITAVAGAAIVAVPLVLQHQTQNKLVAENEDLRQRVQQYDQVMAENHRLSNLVARTSTPAPAEAAPTATNDASREVLRLKGEVGRLRKEQASDEAARRTNTPLSSITSSPEMMKMIREQQKTGMSVIYKDFAKRANLTTEQTEKLNDLLADHVMGNIDQITTVLRDGKAGDEMNQVFKAQDDALQEKVQALLGQDAYSQYQDFTRNIGSYLTAEQFKAKMSGDQAAKDEQSKQLYEVMKQETQAALTKAGLDSDYQTVPMLNFRNIASADEAEKSLNLLSGIYSQVSARAASFLSPEDQKQFTEFTTHAIDVSRAALTMNRKMMAPISK